MFCPNCGTQNPETAPVCSKCNFNLKAAAAPKFKGTMLMMNQQGASAPAPAPVPGMPGSAPPAPPGSGIPGAGGPPRPVAAPTNKLKGTMVGVAPPMPPVAGKPGAPSAPGYGGPPPQNFAPPQQNFAPPAQQNYAPPQQNYAPPPQQNYAPPQQNYAPPPQQNYAPPPQQNYPPQGPGFAPAPPPNFAQTEVDAVPAGQAQFGGGQGVNPLGGTMAADAGAFNPYAAPPQPQGGYGGPPPGGGYAAPPAPPGPAYGKPPDGAGYGSAPGAPPAYGAAPPGQYGAPSYGAAPGGGYGGAPPGYGSNPPQPAYGQQQTYGQPGGPMQSYGQPGDPGSALATLASAGIASAMGGGKRPIARNALLTILLPYGINIVGNIIVSILVRVAAATGIGLLVTLFGLLSYVVSIAFLYFYFVPLFKMANEVKSVTNNQGFNPWLTLIPIYGPLFLLPPEVTNAKRIVGAPEPVRSPVLYFFFPPYALASDVNEIAARMR